MELFMVNAIKANEIVVVSLFIILCLGVIWNLWIVPNWIDYKNRRKQKEKQSKLNIPSSKETPRSGGVV